MSVSPPRPKGPPLNALRAFEAAARLRSFKLAADELCVTSGAIAQHVKSLEEWTESPLFHRHAQGVELTEIGIEILPQFITAFDHLGTAVHSLKTAAKPKQIRIAALPSIAQLWLTPRLPLIREKMPDLQISVTALEAPPNLLRESYDLSIFFGESDISKQTSFSPDHIFPVCAPAIANQIQTLSDIYDHQLLHDLVWHQDWKIWTEEFAINHLKDIKGSTFSLYSMAVEEAVHGAGILIGRESLIRSHLQNGTLVDPLGMKLQSPETLNIAIAPPIKESAIIQQLINQLQSLEQT